MEKFFKLKEHGTDVRTEVTAGLTTFFAMSYILFVNPAMLAQTGMPAQGVFLATIIGAVAGTLMMAFYANLPYAQAPGMGLNAFFTYTVVFSYGVIGNQNVVLSERRAFVTGGTGLPFRGVRLQKERAAAHAY